MSTQIIGSPSYVAGGDIVQCGFVKVDPTKDYQVLAAGVGDVAVGIAQRWANFPTFDNQTATPPAAQIGQGVCIYGPGVQCQMLVGAGGCAAGDKLKVGAGSAGVKASAGDKYFARALQASNPNAAANTELVQVVVEFGTA